MRDRLPLLAGDELRGADLRRVERHLIGCLQCRRRRASLEDSLSVLHAVAAQPLAPPDAPSLWPELARQIRHSRRPAQTPLFTLSRRFGLAPAFGLGFGLLVAVIAVGSRHALFTPALPAPVPVVDQRPPVAPLATAPAPVPTTVVVPIETVAANDVMVKPSGGEAAVAVAAETVPATRYGYDLDHTMPMPAVAESRDTGKQQQPAY